MKIIKRGFAVLLIGLFAAFDASAIVIGSFDGSRSSRPFTGSSYDNIRAYLADPNNFGPTGIVNSTVTVASGIPTATTSALSSYDVFVMSEVASLAPSEVSDLYDFMLGGGDFLIVSDSGTSTTGMNAFLSTVDGSSIGSSAGSNNGSTAVLGGEGASGLFGTVGSLTNTPYRALTPGSLLQITGVSGGSNIMGEILPDALAVGAGGMLITGDVLFMDFFVPPGSLASDEDNANYFLNWFTDTVVAPPSQVPTPGTLVLLLMGLVGVIGSRVRG